MAPAILFLIVFLTIIVWRLVFTGLHRPLLRETAAPEQEHNNIVEQGLHIPICTESLRSLAPRRGVVIMSCMSARRDFMCAIET